MYTYDMRRWKLELEVLEMGVCDVLFPIVLNPRKENKICPAQKRLVDPAKYVHVFVYPR